MTKNISQGENKVIAGQNHQSSDCNGSSKIYTPSSSPLEKEIMEEFDSKFSTIEPITDYEGIIYDKDGKTTSDLETIKSFLLSSLAKVRRETVDSLMKELAFINDLQTLNPRIDVISEIQEIINNKIKE